MFSNNVDYSVPVELFFDADGKDDIRDHLIKKGHFIILTDTINSQDHINDKFSSNTAAELATPSQKGVATMWMPSPRKANTDPLPQPDPLIQPHNQSLPLTSPLMWKPTKLVPTNLSFSDQ